MMVTTSLIFLYLHYFFKHYCLVYIICCYSFPLLFVPVGGWKCQHEQIRVYPANFHFDNDNKADNLMVNNVMPAGIINWDDAITINEWIEFLNNRPLHMWANDNGIADVRKAVLREITAQKKRRSQKDEEFAKEALVNEAVSYHIVHGLNGQQRTTSMVIFANQFKCKNAANLTILLLGEAFLNKGATNYDSLARNSSLDFTHVFDFLSKWHLTNTNALDVVYLPEKMRRRAYVFELFVGTTISHSGVEQWKKAQMIAAFKFKFGFSSQARNAFPKVFHLSESVKCAKRNEKYMETDPFCWARTDPAIQKDLRFVLRSQSYTIGWAVDKHASGFKVIVKQLNFISRHGELHFTAPEIDYEKLDVIGGKQSQGHEYTNKNTIFPDELDDTNFPEIFINK